MSQKCVHKGCGKSFTDTEEECQYHPGPPVFHEGQKGWQCCKARVLTFDEFLSIPPCTTGKHSTVDDTPAPEPKQPIEPEPTPPTRKPVPTTTEVTASSRAPQPAPTAPPPVPIAPPESDTDDPSLPVPPNLTCRRRGCNTTSSSASGTASSRDGEECVYHPGHALFHEGSKGWTCCKRRVLEFDEFMKIEGCKRKSRHLYIGSGKKSGDEEKLLEVRHDFYQTSRTVIASLYLKKIDKSHAKVEFTSPTTISLDLPTADQKRYEKEMPLFGPIDQGKSTYKIMGTKLELTLAKASELSWPTLRSDEQRTSEIIQVGQAGKA